MLFPFWGTGNKITHSNVTDSIRIRCTGKREKDEVRKKRGAKGTNVPPIKIQI